MVSTHPTLAAVGAATKKGVNALSPKAKGLIGELATKAESALRGRFSLGTAPVGLGRPTPTNPNREAKAVFDHDMRSTFSGVRETVESKFGTSGFTPNQREAVRKGAAVRVDRTTPDDVGAATAGAVGAAAAGASTGSENEDEGG